MADAARADESLARGGAVGVLHGLPVAHKDLVDTAGIRTTHGLAVLSRSRADTRRAPGHSNSRGGRGDARQDEHAGVRRRVADLQHGLRRDPQSLRPREDVRRQQRRRRGGAGLRDGAHRRRQRHRGVAAQPGGILQRRRLPAVAGRVPRDSHRGRRCRWRAHGALGRRRSPVPQRDRGTRSAESVVAPGGRRTISARRWAASFKGARVAWWRGLGGIPFEPEIRRVVDDEPPRLRGHSAAVVEEAEPDFAGVDDAFATLRYAANHPPVRAPGARAARLGEGHHQVRSRAGGETDRAPTSAGHWRGRRGCTTRAASSSSATTTSSFP